MYKLVLHIKGDFLVVQLGHDKWERFSDYVKKNQDRLKHQLTLISLRNDNLTLLEVIENLVMKKEMNGVNASATSQYKPMFSINS